jgi:glycosyltransferase involved in cell wall biosynthesis
MKTLMLGWEFPPYISGGLGTACYGLTKAMDKLGVEVTFILPKGCVDPPAGNLKLISAHNPEQSCSMTGFKKTKFRTITSTLRPYSSVKRWQLSSDAIKRAKTLFNKPGLSEVKEPNYGGDMFSEVGRYANEVVEIALDEEFDVVHAHDWMTYPAGIAVSQQTNKPLVVHVHSTEFDRSGEHVNQMVYDIERHGMHAAAKIIAVSNYTKDTIVKHYGIPAEKVEAVYNGVECNAKGNGHAPLNKTNKIVLFLGRMTMQKGPEYFLAAAKKVVGVIDNVKFIMAGSGDMMHRTIDLAARLGIGSKVLFTGFLRGQDVDKAFQMADLYVMPSVSEPFGISSLEAMRQNVPILVSKTSGIAEAVTHALKVDFWDVNEMANKIVAVLKRPPLRATLAKNGYWEANRFRWEDAAHKVMKIYDQVLCCQ